MVCCENCIWNDDCGSDDTSECSFYTPWNEDEDEDEGRDEDADRRKFRSLWWGYLGDRGLWV